MAEVNKMKKAILFGILGLLLIGSVFAYMGSGNRNNMGMMGSKNFNMQQHHEQMEELMEEGSFEDLQKLRQEGFNMMPWVNDEETFKQAQERHEQMEKIMENSNFGRGMTGMMKSGRCSMMD